MPDRPRSRVRSNGNKMDFHVTVSGTRLRKDYILKCAQDGANRLERPLGHLNFVVVNDREMSKLHREYLDIPGTTDVLTFDLTGPVGNELDGEVYICLDQARRQAKHYGVTLNEEIARLAVHGVLHLAGFQDQTVTQKRQMRWMEDQALLSAVDAK